MVGASDARMVFVDSAYRYRAVNQAYCDDYGRTRDQVLGHTVADVIGEEAFERTQRPYFERCLAGERLTLAGWWDSPARGRRHADTRYDPFFEADGSISGVAVHSRDTTDWKMTENHLERSVTRLRAMNEELKAFSDALAHDLRNPLLIVTNYSHQLHAALGDALEEQRREDLERILSAGRHMVHIIDDLRDLTDADRSEISREEMDLSALAEDVIEDLRVLAPDRDVRFETVPGIKAFGDKSLVKILLTNLLQNSWKYTGLREDARIELGVVEDEENEPVYQVRDNGIGFDNADGKKIFRAFERLHTRAEFAGSGLGLATVERIVRRHRGRVWAEGVPGEGAVFRFTLGFPKTLPPGGERRHFDR